MNKAKKKILDEFVGLCDAGDFETFLHTKDYTQIEWDEVCEFISKSLDEYVEAVLPERKTDEKDGLPREYKGHGNLIAWAKIDGWNDCLDQIEENIVQQSPK